MTHKNKLRALFLTSLPNGGQDGDRGTAPPAHNHTDPPAGAGAGTTNAGDASSSIAVALAACTANALAAQQAAYPSLAPQLQQPQQVFSWPSPRGMYAVAGGRLALIPERPDKPKQPLAKRGVSVGALVGWRIWRVRVEDRLLQSYAADRVWLPNEPMEGKLSDHGPEGVWAFADVCHAVDKIRPPAVDHSRYALGSVWLWGEVIEHSMGYRAEYAEVRSLDWVSAWTARAFGFPVDVPVTANATLTRVRSRSKARMLMPPDSELLDQLRRRYGVTGDPEIVSP